MLKLSNLLKISYLNNILTLIKGVAGAQIIHLLGIPILTRMYGPEEFGLLSLFLVSASILVIVVSGGFNHAVLAAQSDEDARSVIRLQVFFSLLSSCFLLLVTILFRSFVENIANLEIKYFVICIVYAWLNSLYFAIYAWNIRQKNFKRVARNRIRGTIANYLFSVSLFFIWKSPYGLIGGYIVEQLVFWLGLYFESRSDRLYSGVRFNRHLLTTLKQFSSFPTMLIPANIIGKVSEQIHFILISRFFGVSSIAPLEIYRKAVGMPVSLIGTTVGDVFKQRSSADLQGSGNCLNIFLKTTILLLAISIIPTLVLWFYGPWAFALVMGEKWRIAGEYAQILAPVFLFGFVVSPLTALFLISDKQHYGLITNIVSLLLTGTFMLLAFQQYQNIESVLVAYSIAYCLKYLIQYYFCFIVARGMKR